MVLVRIILLQKISNISPELIRHMLVILAADVLGILTILCLIDIIRGLRQQKPDFYTTESVCIGCNSKIFKCEL